LFAASTQSIALAGMMRITVGEEPSRAGIDPRNLLIDTQWRDDTIDVTPLLKRTSPSGARAPSRS
jgi:hypothetical protein